LGIIKPVPLLGSPARAVDVASTAGLEAVAAGRLVLGASSLFPTGGIDARLGGDLSAVHGAALRSQGALAEAGNHLNVARSALAGAGGAILPQVSSPALAMLAEVDHARHQLVGARKGLSLLADLSDPATDVRLLLLSQDSLELRATGGYVGSYGVLHFLHGSVRLDKYEATEDLPDPKPMIPPPADLAVYLPGPWRLSNVNWWPDFPTTATAARDMFRRQGGGDVQGVIALTELATARMIGATGPLQIPGYEKPVTEDGFDKRVVYEVEQKMPRDVPRKKFLTELAATLFERLFALPPDRVPLLAEAVARSAGAGDIALWFNEPARESLIDGAVVEGRLPRTQGDFLMLVDANLSATKANLDLTRDVVYRVARENGGWVGHLRARIRDDADKTAINPYYNGYLRVYVPLGSKLVGNRSDQTDSGPAPDGPYEVFSQLVNVDPRGEQVVTFDYELPPAVAASGRYRLSWVRQSGTPRDTLAGTVEGRSFQSVPGERTLLVEGDGKGHGVIDWLRSRWVVKKLID